MSILVDKFGSYICYDENYTKKLLYLDEKFKKIAFSFGAVEYHIPAMINHEILEKCGYFDTFPQHITVACHADKTKISHVIKNNIIDNQNSKISNNYFTPAACLHIYPMIENTKIDEKVITTKARVYRYENEDFDGETRLWDFTVREIVFIGNKKFVNECLQKTKEKVWEIASKLNLPIEINRSYDMFFNSKKNIIRQKIQYSNSQKFELNINVNGKKIALASFNYHDTHFSKIFNFDDKENIVTGCVGFGLERWVYALNEYKIKIR